jgi:hypothetical protein
VIDMWQRLRRWWASEARANLQDALLAWSIGGLASFAIIISEPASEPISIVSFALIAVQSAALTVRRRWPLGVYTVVGIGTIVYAWVGDPWGSVAGLGVLVA